MVILCICGDYLYVSAGVNRPTHRKNLKMAQIFPSQGGSDHLES